MPNTDQYVALGTRFRARMNLPLTSLSCFIGWVLASALYYTLIIVAGGPVEGDASETVYSTWSVAHGDLACAYPQLATYHLDNLANPFAQTAPLYPLITGAAAAILRIGHAVPFPAQNQLGLHCANAVSDFFNWSVNAGAILPTIRLSYLVWPVLMAGAIALIRASGRGRTRWEILLLLMIACTPTVIMCTTFYFHPEDVLAMGLILMAVACAVRRTWVWAGVVIVFACCTQQYAFLVAASLLVVVPAGSRLRFILGAMATAAVIDVPLIVATSGRVVKTILLGSSRVGIINRSTGGTVLWETDFKGTTLFLLSRVAPIAAAVALTWWASKRLGPRVLSPIPMASIMATAIVLRLVFEENLFGYYFMAASVALVALDAVRGQIRGTTLAWIALVTVAFNPFNAGFFSNLTGHTLNLHYAVPIVAMALVVASVLLDALYHRVRPYKIAWIVVAALTSETKLWGARVDVFTVPHWLWQVILVPIALALAINPLLSEVNLTKTSTFDTPMDTAVL